MYKFLRFFIRVSSISNVSPTIVSVCNLGSSIDPPPSTLFNNSLVIVSSCKLLHWSKILLSSDLIFAPILSEVKFSHLKNAVPDNSTTLSGKTTLFNFLYPAKKFSPIFVMPSGTTTSITSSLFMYKLSVYCKVSLLSNSILQNCSNVPLKYMSSKLSQ